MNSLSQILTTLYYMGPPLLVAMILHEYAHGWVANRCGDPTARLEGRLTLNPLVHIDPIGTIMVPLMCVLQPVGMFFGWATPVPVDPEKLNKPRRDMALVAMAGPGMNLLLAIASALVLRLAFVIDPSIATHWAPEPSWIPRHDFSGMPWLLVAAIATYSIWINLLLMAFNLIPIPPLDGGRVLMNLLPYKVALALSHLEPFGMMLVVSLFIFDSHLHVIGTVTGTFVPFLAQTLGPGV